MAPRYRWDDFVLDLDAYRLERAGRPLALEPKALNLLALLVSRPDHLFTKQEIFDQVWAGTAVSDHALTRVVAQIRRVLGDDVKEARYLETVPTRGYRWVRAVEVDDPGDAAALQPSQAPSVDRALERPRPVRQWWMAAAVVIGIGATAVAVWALRSEGNRSGAASADGGSGWGIAAALRGQFPVQVTTHPGLDLDPVFSPSGDAVAFASERSGSFEIYVRSVGAGAADVAVTADGGQNVQPAWSPDAARIAYHSAARGGVWIVPARGGTPRQLVERGSNPSWSPDGRRIVYQSDEHPDITPTGYAAHVGSILMTVDVGSGTSEPLTARGGPAGGHGTPAWSSSGRHVVFSVFDAGADNGTWVVDVTTRAARPIRLQPKMYEAVFAEADTAIYVASGDPVIYRVPFDPETGEGGEGEPIVVAGVPGVRGLSVSADGRQLVFAGLALRSHIWAQPIRGDGRPAGDAYALTSDTSRRNSAPSVSPDGARVAYSSARRGELPNIWIMDLATRTPLQLTEDEAFDREPSWSRDGQRVLYTTDRPGHAGVRAIDIDTRRDELIVSTARPPDPVPGFDPVVGRLTEIQLSPSASRAAFATAVPPYGFRRMFLADLASYTARALTDGSVSTGYPAWSPDERLIAVEIQTDRSTQLGMIDTATGRLRSLTNVPGQVWVRSWSPDSRRVAAAVLERRLWRLSSFDVHSGEETVIVPPGPPNGYFRYPDWSARNDLVVFERAEMTGNIWRLTLPDVEP